MDNPNTYTDDRGVITDLLVTGTYSVTHVTFNEGAVRGNHYHEKTRQVDTVLKGKLLCSQDGNEVILNEGATMVHEPGVAHAYKALEESEIISTCFGVRKGADYEKDVFRLDEEDKLL